jgi:hypothetical protein
MASGFYVNLEHLGSFGNQVRRNQLYALDATEKMNLASLSDELVFSGGVAGMSAHGWIVPSVKKWLDQADRNNDAVSKALSRSTRALEFSYSYYAQVDNDQAARLDRAYQPADLATAVGTTEPIAPGTKVSTARPIAASEVRHDPHPRPGHREQPLDYTAKDYHWVNLQPLQKRGANTEPDAVFGQNWVLEVDKVAKNVKDALPSISVPPVRIALERILGENAVEKISELVTGDWLAVEKVARALHWHGQVQQDLHDNLMRGLFAMQGMWTGGAASQMQDSMQRLVRDGITSHARFLREARDRITKYAEATYYTFRVVQEFIDIAIDHLEPSVIARYVKEGMDLLSSGLYGIVTGKWEQVTSKVKGLQIAADAAGATIAYHAALSGNPRRAYIPEGFSHPADTDRNGSVAAGEMKAKR